MIDILYHDRTIQPEYSEDGKLLNNWNPDRAFSDGEYVEVWFRIETPNYYHPDRLYSEMFGFDSAEERALFYQEVKEIFESMNWACSDTASMWNGRSHLYVHPQEISGWVQKWEVAYIAETLAKHKGRFGLRWVDLYRSKTIGFERKKAVATR